MECKFNPSLDGRRARHREQCENLIHQHRALSSFAEVIRFGSPSQVDCLVKCIKEGDSNQDIMVTVDRCLQRLEDTENSPTQPPFHLSEPLRRTDTSFSKIAGHHETNDVPRLKLRPMKHRERPGDDNLASRRTLEESERPSSVRPQKSFEASANCDWQGSIPVGMCLPQSLPDYEQRKWGDESGRCDDNYLFHDLLHSSPTPGLSGRDVGLEVQENHRVGQNSPPVLGAGAAAQLSSMGDHYIDVGREAREKAGLLSQSFSILSTFPEVEDLVRIDGV